MYKIVAIEDDNGQMRDTIKISSSPEKITTPGLKMVYRIINKLTKKSEGDYIALSYEQPEKEEKLHMFHPVHTLVPIPHSSIFAPCATKFIIVYSSRSLDAIILVSTNPASSNNLLASLER